MDIRKAFDSVSHQQLLLKLHTFGIVGETLQWLKSYLLDRRHCVSLAGYSSDYLPVKSGIPQGSILGPLLFLIYVNDMFPYVIHSSLLMFADDSQCLKQIESIQDCRYLQSDLYDMARWCSK